MAGDAIQIPMPKIATATTQNTIQGVADFMNGDEDFIIFRKFRHLHIELLLKLQTELGEANSVLLDDEEDRRGVARALLEYSNILASLQRVSALRNPNKVNVSDLRDWVRDHGLKEESLCSFLKDEKGLEDDLVAPSLPLEEEDGVNKLVNTVFWRAISTAVQSDSKGSVFKYENETVQRIGRTIVLALSSALLLIPIVILYFVTKGFWPLFIVIIWTILFTALAAFLTSARNTEVMMAAAAYAAVMVVFVSK
ncbi:hypothetical protein L207DRAFT_633550 [Hyaloscypha variabilis F]|uniref:DUF6594 domain-containing protein n=1 Tax=Hyaloscypha variabilis (strain UAMH 11265 / GT02V1 / F) TaxID=1149755 RepID=A0A2J6RPW3_HYAVF|nr:hypothetical protein L207DRAFT_633550 [Hyaloscypha variabilis F]